MLVKLTEKQLIMSEEVLKYATNEEVEQIRKVCQNIADRANTARLERKAVLQHE